MHLPMAALKWMLTPNAILQIENPQTLILAVVVLIIGMVLFTGVIIAFNHQCYQRLCRQ